MQVVRLGRAGVRTEIGEGGTDFRGVAVFDPTSKFLCGQAANVGGEVGFSADEFTEADEFVGAKFVGFETMIGGRFFGVGAVPEINAAWAFFGGAPAVAPSVGIRKTTARVA